MTIRSILAPYVGDATGSSGLKLAVHMARKYNACLTAVFWHGPDMLQSRYSGYMTSDVLRIFEERDKKLIEEVQQDFDSHIAAAGLSQRSDFIDIGSTSDFSLSECARTHDVVVMSSAAIDLGQEYYSARPDVVAMRGGRPVILVPSAYEVESLIENAVIAWDGSRAAARALGDGMQILETKTKVTVLTVGEALPERAGADVMKLLRRHGVEAERVVRPSRGGVGATIMDTCDEVGAGLLIMGAYEHSMIREEFLGGVTREIVEKARIPVLLSH